MTSLFVYPSPESRKIYLPLYRDVYYMKMRKLSILYMLLGVSIGISLAIAAYSYSLNTHQLALSLPNLIQLHKNYPLHFAIDIMPVMLGVSLFMVGIKAEKQIKYGNRLRLVIEQKTEDLKESNKKLNAIFNSSSDINVLISLDHKILAFNRAAAAFMLDISGKQFLTVGDDIFDHVSELAKESFSISLDIASSGKKIKFVENFRLFKTTLGKKLIWLFIELQPVLNDDGMIEAVSMNITDITKRKEIEEAIRKQNTQLKKIAWIQSHQIRKPVANILGLIPLFNDVNLNEEQKELLHNLKVSTNELDDYIKEIVTETTPIDADN